MEAVIKRRPIPDAQSQFDDTLHPVLKRIYQARGVTSQDQLEYALQKLHPFQLLSHIEDAATLLADALASQKRIVIVGDYDTDGATSTTLAVQALRAFGGQHVDFLVPNRFEFGYGLTPEIVALAKEKKAEVLVTVDNGIVSFEGVHAAKAAGMQVLITDHHLAADQLPNADAIVNPNQPGDTFPSKVLAGVGVIFYVMLALRATLRANHWFQSQSIAEPNMARFLDLVALGTVADVVPLDHNNRILVDQGMKRIRAGECGWGIKALITVSGKDCRQFSTNDLGFMVAPRLNAAGRLDDMSIGVACLLSNNAVQSRLLAQQLDQLNEERKRIESDMRDQAMASLKKIVLSEAGLPLGLCLYDASWHQGIIGILAARVKERYHRPVIAFAKAEDGSLKGSARSIPGVHIRDVLESVTKIAPGVIDKFGGHAMAAGLSLPLKKRSAFEAAFLQALDQHLTPDVLENTLLTDGHLEVSDLSMPFASILKNAGPWGQAFPEPVFDGEFLLLDQRLVGKNHLKMVLQSEGGDPIDAIAFNIDLEKWPNQRCEKIQVAYQLDINEFRGMRQVQLIVKWLKAI